MQIHYRLRPDKYNFRYLRYRLQCRHFHPCAHTLPSNAVLDIRERDTTFSADDIRGKRGRKTLKIFSQHRIACPQQQAVERSMNMTVARFGTDSYAGPKKHVDVPIKHIICNDRSLGIVLSDCFLDSGERVRAGEIQLGDKKNVGAFDLS